MKIGEPTSTPTYRRAVFWLLSLGGILLLAFFLSARRNLVPLNRLRSVRTTEAFTTLRIDMDFANYNLLLEQRERALEEGAVLGEDSDFLPAIVRVEDEATSVQLQLMEGPTAGLGPDDQWPFEVRVSDGATLLGLRRFYLQDPDLMGGEGYLALNRVLRAEDLLATRVRLVRLVFNGDDRGLYALQEGFTDVLLEQQGRAQGVMAGFDNDLFWQQVVHFGGDIGAALTDPVLDLEGLHYLEVEALGDATQARDPELEAQRSEALSRLHALQAGKRPAAEVLDIDRYARFLALIDLWGFPELASPLNLGFYYQPEAKRLEPVAFTRHLPSEERLSLAATYGDPHLQIAYAREAFRVSKPDYLEVLQADFEAEFDPALWARLAERQQFLQRSLDPVQPVFAYLAESTPETHGVLRVGIANVTRLPVEILGLDVGALTFVDLDPAWQQDGQEERVAGTEGIVLRSLDPDDGVNYVHFDVPLSLITTQDTELGPHGHVEISIATRVAGTRDVGVHNGYRLTPARPGLPALLVGEE